MVQFDGITTPSGITKTITLFTSLIATSLYQKYASVFFAFQNRDAFSFTSLNSPVTFFVLFFILVSYIFDGNKPGNHKISEFIFNVMMGILNIAVGGLLIDKAINSHNLRNEYETGCIVSGVFYIITALLQLTDAFLVFKSSA